MPRAQHTDMAMWHHPAVGGRLPLAVWAQFGDVRSGPNELLGIERLRDGTDGWRPGVGPSQPGGGMIAS